MGLQPILIDNGVCNHIRKSGDSTYWCGIALGIKASSTQGKQNCNNFHDNCDNLDGIDWGWKSDVYFGGKETFESFPKDIEEDVKINWVEIEKAR